MRLEGKLSFLTKYSVPNAASTPFRKLKHKHLKVLGAIKKYPHLSARRKDDLWFKNFVGDDVLKKIKYRNSKPTVTAIYKGIAKYDKPNNVKTFPELEKVMDWLDREYGSHMAQAGIISFEEGLKGMDMSKSPGFPWHKIARTKGEVLSKGYEEELRMLVEDFDNLSRPRFIWTSSLKEESRKIAKLANHNVRQFSASPMEAVVLGRMLFLQQNEAFYDSHLETMSAVGVSTRNGGWQRCWDRLSKHKRGFELDAKEWDSSLQRVLLILVRDLRLRWLRRVLSESDYSKIEMTVINYYEEIIDSVYVLPFGEFVQKFLGNPSGCINTVVDNTLILSALLMITWMRTVGTSYEDFKHRSAALLYGDDNTFSVSEDIIEIFNGKACKRVFGTFGVIIKGEEKELEPRPVDELSFLSFGFYAYKDKLVIPLYQKPDKLLCSLAFRDNGQGLCMRLQRALAIRELLFGTKWFGLVSEYCLYLMRKGKGMDDSEFLRVCSLYKQPEEMLRMFVRYEADAPLKLCPRRKFQQLN